MRRILSLFESFRSLEAALRKAEGQALYWQGRTETAEAMTEKRQYDYTQALKMVADQQAIAMGYRPIFGVAPPLPRDEEIEPAQLQAPQRVMASDLVAQSEREFAKEYAAALEREWKRNNPD